MSTLIQRCLGAARLDGSVYEDVEADERSTGQAMLVVALTSLAGGIGAMDQYGTSEIAGAVVVSVIAWFVWAACITLIGTRILPEPQTEADLGQVIRTTGFSASPGFLQVFGIVPALGPIVGVVTNLWMLAAMVVAVRHALDYTSLARTILVTVLGFMAFVAVLAAAAAMTGIGLGMLEAVKSAGT
jgi:hypothetical protein